MSRAVPERERCTGRVAQTTTRTRERSRRGEGATLRDDLIAAALELAEQSGSDAMLSLRGVAREAGVSPQAVYLHFKDLTELIEGVLDMCERQLEEAVLDELAGVSAPLDRLLAIAAAYVRWGVEHPGLYQVMYEGEVQGTRPVPRGAMGERLIAVVTGDLEAAREGGEIAEGEALVQLVQTWALLHGIVSIRVNKPHFDWPDAVPMAQEGMLRLLGADTGRGHSRVPAPAEASG